MPAALPTPPGLQPAATSAAASTRLTRARSGFRLILRTLHSMEPPLPDLLAPLSPGAFTPLRRRRGGNCSHQGRRETAEGGREAAERESARSQGAEEGPPVALPLQAVGQYPANPPFQA